MSLISLYCDNLLSKQQAFGPGTLSISDHLGGAEASNSSNSALDPMVVVLGAPKKMGLGTGRHPLRRRNCQLLALASIVCGVMILWNHIVTLPSSPSPLISIRSYTMESTATGTTTSKTMQESNNHERQDSTVQGEASNAKPTHRAADPLPTSLYPFLPLRAADALQCRESVVSFVINATDAKDECQGLKKAFDKTCGDQPTAATPQQQQPQQQRPQQHQVEPNPQQQQVSKQSSHGLHFKHRFQNRRRKRIKNQNQQKRMYHQRRLGLAEENTDDLYIRSSYYWNLIELWLWQTQRKFHDIWRLWFGQTNDFLFVEDEIIKVWNDAEHIVSRDWDSFVYVDLRRKLLDRDSMSQPSNHRRLVQFGLSNKTIPSSNVLASNATKHVSSNLDLPTLKKHAGDGVIQDVLILQQGDKLINQTNAAAQEAAVSSKAMSNTAAAVSAVLNDPSSVEARTCCSSILNVYHENCNSSGDEQISDRRLFLIVLVMALCGMVKSLIRHFRILWLPEAAGCIAVGIASGYVLMFFPHHDISFDGQWFLRIMVPPIIFEAALSIDKTSFNRHVVPILLYATIGTLLATVITAEILHRGSSMCSSWCTPIPYIESLLFGALISSIDPIAVLSVLSNMGMTDKDTIYVLIFGESLLNDGVAIVLFETLVNFLDDHMIIDQKTITEATSHFFVVAFGSLMVGAIAGYAGTAYFWLFQGCQTPLVEVLLFFCWALLPYYVCDGIGWSGIVSTVSTGFIMDIHIVGQRCPDLEDSEARISEKPLSTGHLSATARTHIGFVTGLIATTMETAIFAYLGLFLFSHRYHWSINHGIMAVLACCVSRGMMIPFLSFFANMFTKLRQITPWSSIDSRQSTVPVSSGGVIIDHKMQFVLWFAGLRGAMSFALVESIPMYDSISGEGTPLKPELKAMTSGCIMFSVFFLGGYTYYVMEYLGLAPGTTDEKGHVDEESADSLLGQSMEGTHQMVSKGRRRLRSAV